MAITRLKRKGKKNKVVAKGKVASIQLLTARPVIKNVDIEAIKAEFAANATKGKKVEKKAEAVVEAPVAEVATDVVSEEKPAKKAAPKAKKEEAKED